MMDCMAIEYRRQRRLAGKGSIVSVRKDNRRQLGQSADDRRVGVSQATAGRVGPERVSQG